MKWTLLVFAIALGLIAQPSQATRWRHSLEQYELTTIRLIFTNPKDKCQCQRPYATFADPNGFLHHAFVGDYIGRHFGLVVEIAADSILIKEVHQDSRGEWIEKRVRVRKSKDD